VKNESGAVKYSRKPLMTERSDEMSVIGRLDDQVERVLIDPLRRRERNEDEGEREAPPLQPPPAPSHEEREAESSDATRAVQAALPVWLL
jgi:hypothetical protein